MKLFGKRKKDLFKKLEALEIKLGRSNEFITDILTWRAGEKLVDASTGPNPYDTREKLITELVKKYKGYARWGNQLVQRIVDTRAAFALGRGIKANAGDKSDNSEPEFDFISKLMSDNGLDGQFGQQLAVEKELEGQVLLHLVPKFENDRLNGININFISWLDTKYEVKYLDTNYSRIELITYNDPYELRPVEILPEEAIFIKFNARANSREGIPTLSGLLVECEDIDRGLRDWRAINKYFSSPTPYFKTEDMESARDLYEQLTDPKVNWRIGKVFAGPAEFKLVGMSEDGISSIREEIETKIKVLAGGAGVPVQFLGFPEFMSNRSTAENTMEPVEAIAMSEQMSWIEGMQELFDKAITMRNSYESAYEKPLRTGLVKPSIPFVTSAQIRRLIDLYLPAFQAGAIDSKTFQEMLP